MQRPRQDASPNDVNLDDHALMARVQARDSTALASLFDRYGGAVYGLCLRALRDEGEAEDLLVDIFWELWEKGGRYDRSRGSPIGHLMGLARSRLVDRLRSRRSRYRLSGNGTGLESASSETTDPLGGPVNDAIFSEQRDRVIRAMASLPPEQREALEMAFFNAMTHSEVAEQLCQPLGTIKTRIRQALIQLRGALASET